jgi:hypothetical protein
MLDSAQGSDSAPIFGNLSQKEIFSDIKLPLAISIHRNRNKKSLLYENRSKDSKERNMYKNGREKCEQKI